MDLKDIDHVVFSIDSFEQECEFELNFSEYTANKIKLMYGFKLPQCLSFSSNDDDIDEIRCFVPQCYRIGTVYILPFHEFEKLYSFIQREIIDFLNWRDVDTIIAVAKSNKESVDDLYDYLRENHQSIIDGLNERQQLG